MGGLYIFHTGKAGHNRICLYIGTYRTVTDDYRAQRQVEQSDQHYFKNVTFTAAQNHQRSITRYSLVSGPLAVPQITDFYSVLWQHKIGSSASYTE